MQVAGCFDWAQIIRVLTFHYQLQLLCLLKTSVCYQPIFMADFPCPECTICFAAPHQCNGHRRLVHQSTCKVELLSIDRWTANILAPWRAADALPSLEVNPLEGSPKCSCGKRDSKRRSRLPTLKRGRGSSWEPRD